MLWLVPGQMVQISNEEFCLVKCTRAISNGGGPCFLLFFLVILVKVEALGQTSSSFPGHGGYFTFT